MKNRWIHKFSSDVQTSAMIIFLNSTQLMIDDEDKAQEQSGSLAIPDTGGTLYMGKENFKGCISNLYTRR